MVGFPDHRPCLIASSSMLPPQLAGCLAAWLPAWLHDARYTTQMHHLARCIVALHPINF